MFDLYSFHYWLHESLYGPYGELTGMYLGEYDVGTALFSLVLYFLIHFFVFRCIISCIKYIWRVL